MSLAIPVKMGFEFIHTRLHFVVLAVAFTAYVGQLSGQVNVGNSVPFSSDALSWRIESFYKYRKDGKPGRVITLELKQRPNTGTVAVKVNCNSVTETTILNIADTTNQFSILLPEGAGVDRATTAWITLTMGGKDFSEQIQIPQNKQWTVYIYPHSHVDIGYTGLQEDVEKIHVRNIDVGIDLAQKTQHYPEGSRFIWNTESTWVVDVYLKQASEKQRLSFFEAVSKGWIQIDAGHSNISTTVCSDEELVHFFKNSKEISRLTKKPINTMVQMDLPGAAWGLVPIANQNGISGFISFPNNYDLRKIWEHKPFYWRGPDSKSKILFLQAYPYGIGYTIKGSKYGLATLQAYSDKYDRVSTSEPLKNFVDAFLFNETSKLEATGSPYDFFVMAWSMADNCVIDADLPEAVKQWNEIYAYPKLIIAGSRDILSAFEKKYGEIIPEYSGDFTEFWTNGLGSDALSVGRGRQAKENLIQAQALSVINKAAPYSRAVEDSAWENILLSDEHTWGYQNPEAPLAKIIEKRKASFFSNAAKQSMSLIQSFYDSTVVTEQYAIVNTLSWERQGIVTLSGDQSRSGDKVIELSSGKEVPSQRLLSGELIFKTNSIPALASRMYKVVKGSYSKRTSLTVSKNVLRNEFLSVALDTMTGNINSVLDLKTRYDFVSVNEGLNSYHYLPGVFNGRGHTSKPSTTDSVTVIIKEKGPLLVSLVITNKAEGTRGLKREVRLYQGESYILIKNTFDKIGTRKKEGIHFGFSFNIPQPVSHVDAPWSIVIPETNQLPGANRNWMSFQRWVDISGTNKGVTWTAIEAPLIEWGEISGTVLDGGRQYDLWKKKSLQCQALYSWPLNNHWNTNFPLEQAGVMVQQYALLFHGPYDVVKANQFGTSQHRPLIAIKTSKNWLDNSLVTLSNRNVAVSGLYKDKDGSGYIIRLRSFSENPEKLTLLSKGNHPVRPMRLTDQGQSIPLDGKEITLLPFASETLYVAFEKDEQIVSNYNEKKIRL